MTDTEIVISRPLELRIELVELEDDYFRAETKFQKTKSRSTIGDKARVLFAKREWLAFLQSLRMFYTDKSCGLLFCRAVPFDSC